MLRLEDIQDIEVDGIDGRDYPDFVDAFISSANWKDGSPLSDDELEELNSNYGEFVYEQVIAKGF